MHPVISEGRLMSIPDCSPGELWFNGGCQTGGDLSTLVGLGSYEGGTFAGSRYSSADFLIYTTDFREVGSEMVRDTFVLVPGANSGTVGPYPLVFGIPVVEKRTETYRNSASAGFQTTTTVEGMVYDLSIGAYWGVVHFGTTSFDGVVSDVCWDGVCSSIQYSVAETDSCVGQAERVQIDAHRGCMAADWRGIEWLRHDVGWTAWGAAMGGAGAGALGLSIIAVVPAAAPGLLPAMVTSSIAGGGAGYGYASLVCDELATEAYSDAVCACPGLTEALSDSAECSGDESESGCRECKTEEVLEVGGSGYYQTAPSVLGSTANTDCATWEWNSDGNDSNGDGFCD
jgi:hypothetical protein